MREAAVGNALSQTVDSRVGGTISAEGHAMKLPLQRLLNSINERPYSKGCARNLAARKLLLAAKFRQTRYRGYGIFQYNLFSVNIQFNL